MSQPFRCISPNTDIAPRNWLNRTIFAVGMIMVCVVWFGIPGFRVTVLNESDVWIVNPSAMMFEITVTRRPRPLVLRALPLLANRHYTRFA